jgi:hypothetical protein
MNKKNTTENELILKEYEIVFNATEELMFLVKLVEDENQAAETLFIFGSTGCILKKPESLLNKLLGKLLHRYTVRIWGRFYLLIILNVLN